jgi:hypothetical protein
MMLKSEVENENGNSDAREIHEKDKIEKGK